MFDPKKNYLTVGKGNRTMWEQDGVLYDPSTRAPVNPNELGKNTPMLVCKICGVRRSSPVEFREHLIASHPETIADIKARENVSVTDKAEVQKEKTGPDKEKDKVQMTTETVREKPNKKTAKKNTKKKN